MLSSSKRKWAVAFQCAKTGRAGSWRVEDLHQLLREKKGCGAQHRPELQAGKDREGTSS